MQETREFEAVGVITSEESLAVPVLSDGAVVQLKAHDDDIVHKGDVIAQLDTQQLQTQLAKAMGDKERAAGEAGRAGAEAANAERKARLASRLLAAGVGSPADVKGAELDAEGAGAGGGAAIGAEKAAEAQIKDTLRLMAAATLRAPMDGIVSAIKFHEGEVPHTGQTLARVFNPNKLQVKFALPRNKRNAVKEGDHIELIYGVDHKVAATINKNGIVNNNDVAIDFYTVIADLDKNQAHPDDLQVGVRGTVHIADKGVAQ
ncbi:MAG TPA: biotin/lipoyl-binding protein [Kofleriaceae bacterium]|jgi:multidrug efflux pump subunit AcrA (membrane-fusion protein)